MTKKQHWPVVLNKFADISFKEDSTGSGDFKSGFMNRGQRIIQMKLYIV